MTHTTSHAGQEKLFPLEEGIEVYQIVLKCLVIGYLLEEIDRSNLDYLKNFQLKILLWIPRNHYFY